MSDSAFIDQFEQRIVERTSRIAVIGLGYVGLPLLKTILDAGFHCTGIDTDPSKSVMLAKGQSYLRHVEVGEVAHAIQLGRCLITQDHSAVSTCDAIIICVPTPLTKYREPDLSYVENTVRSIAPFARKGQLIVLESTTYPGTTVELIEPILQEHGLTGDNACMLAYSPEREDPGNTVFKTGNIPKVVGGDSPQSLRIACKLYAQFIETVIPVSSTQTAEAVKITENIFRAVNIALVNELKVVYQAMGIDIWEVIDAAASKPFGYMPFYPGPGLGGHCIPIDPFYLTWKAREFELPTKFIELAGEINKAMPAYIVERLALELDRRFSKGINGSVIIICGLAYKKNIDDLRESPALKLFEILEGRGAKLAFHDPYIPVIPPSREHMALAGRQSVALDQALVAAADAVLIATDHDSVDYGLIAGHAKLVLDTRNVMSRLGFHAETIAKA